MIPSLSPGSLFPVLCALPQSPGVFTPHLSTCDSRRAVPKLLGCLASWGAVGMQGTGPSQWLTDEGYKA